MIVSLPNVAHWSMRISLLLGQFRYSESGILDRDHLRFFTHASARELLRQAGFTVVSRAAVPLPIDRWNRNSVVGFLLKTLETADKIVASLFPSAAAFQWVFSARHSAEIK